MKQTLGSDQKSRQTRQERESAEHYSLAKDHWESMVLPVCDTILAGDGLSSGCHEACLYEVSFCQKEARNRVGLRLLWRALTSGHISGRVGAADPTTVNLGGIQRALENCYDGSWGDSK